MTIKSVEVIVEEGNGRCEAILDLFYGDYKSFDINRYDGLALAAWHEVVEKCKEDGLPYLIFNNQYSSYVISGSDVYSNLINIIIPLAFPSHWDLIVEDRVRW